MSNDAIEMRLGQGLRSQLEINATLDEISSWAHQFYLRHARELKGPSRDAVMDLISMCDGPEFEFKYEDLWLLADKLAPALLSDADNCGTKNETR